MNEKIDIRGVMFDNISFEETVDTLLSRLERGVQTSLFTPNSEIVQACIEDPTLYDIVNSGDIIIPDGIGIIKAGKILGTPFMGGKIAGIDVGEALFSILNEKESDNTIYLLGGKPGVAEAARDALLVKYPALKFIGCSDGYFKKEGEENEAVIDMLNETSPDVLFVCFGAPAQEKWIHDNRSRLPSIKLFLALGGSLDGYSGNVKRAPRFFIKLGLEWFYRLLCEPWRYKRMLKLPEFYFGTRKYKRKMKHKTK